MCRAVDVVAVEGDIDAHFGQRRIVVGAECGELLGALLDGAVGAEQPVLEVERHLGHERPLRVVRSGDFDRRDKVLASVGAQYADRDLAAGEDDRLGEVLQQETQRRSGVGHRIGAVQDDESVVARVVVADELRQMEPQRRSDVRRVDDRRERLHVDAYLQRTDRRKFVVDAAEVERHEHTRGGIGLHADRSAGIDDEDGGEHIVFLC